MAENEIDREPEAPVGPGPGEQQREDPVPPGYAGREQGETSEQTGAEPEGTEGGGEAGEASQADPDEGDGPRVHTSAQEGHPAGEGPRSDRDIGGPIAEEDAPDSTGGATGTRPSGFDSHE